MSRSASDRRRSRRHDVRIPVVLRGKDEEGRDFFSRSEIVSVDQFGALIRARFLLKVGTQIELLLPGEQQPKRLRVVWRGDTKSFETGLVGTEFIDPNDSWDATLLTSP